MNDSRCDVLGPLLSGYIDDELTQEKRQFVEVHARHCEHCQQQLAELSALKARFDELDFAEVPTQEWRERMDDPTVTNTQSIGWILFIGGILLAGAWGVVSFFNSPEASVLAKFIVGGVYGGLILLLVSVLRQRLIERKTDKYEDVEI